MAIAVGMSAPTARFSNPMLKRLCALILYVLHQMRISRLAVFSRVYAVPSLVPAGQYMSLWLMKLLVKIGSARI